MTSRRSTVAAERGRDLAAVTECRAPLWLDRLAGVAWRVAVVVVAIFLLTFLGAYIPYIGATIAVALACRSPRPPSSPSTSCAFQASWASAGMTGPSPVNALVPR